MSARGLTRRALLGGALAAGALAALPARRAIASSRSLPWRNWSGFQECRPARRLGPLSEAEVAALLREGGGVIRPAGAGHSFSALVPTDDALLFLDRMSGLVDSDAASLQAEVWAGTRLGPLGPALGAIGQAMPNLPDIDYQTLGGALATSTHGTGARFGSLSSQVVSLTLATPRGELLECDAQRNAEVFHAARTSLGALGVVTRARLQNQAPVRLGERTEWRDLDAVLADLPRERDTNRHFEFYAFPHASVALAISTNETDAEPGATVEDDPGGLHTLRALHRATRWLPAALADPLYDALIRASPSGERIDWSHRVLAHPRTTRFNEMEYTVPAAAGPDCLRELLAVIRARARRLLPDRVPPRARRRRLALDVPRARGGLDLGARVPRRRSAALLRRGRAGVLEVRRPPALGQAAHARRGSDRRALSEVARLPGRAPRARSRGAAGESPPRRSARGLTHRKESTRSASMSEA